MPTQAEKLRRRQRRLRKALDSTNAPARSASLTVYPPVIDLTTLDASAPPPIPSPFKNLVISISGHYGCYSHDDIKKKIEWVGARYIENPTSECTHFITTVAEVRNNSLKVNKALNVYSCEVVSLDWLAASEGAKKPLPEGPYRIRLKKDESDSSVPELTTGMKRLLDEGVDGGTDSIIKRQRMGFVSDTDKLIIPAHRACPFKYEYSIAVDIYGHPWDAKLINASANEKKNEFYHLQLLVHKSEQSYVSWACWGKVGDRPTCLRAKPCDPDAARDDFETRFFHKTGISWWQRFEDASRPGKHVWVPPSYVTRNPQDDPRVEENKRQIVYNISPPECTLPMAVQKVVAFIMNNNELYSEAASPSYDARKLPLGQLSRQTVMEGYNVLQKLSNLVSGEMMGGADQHAEVTKRLSSEYFSIIPHVFGRNETPVINTMRDVDKETELLNELANAVIANEIISSAKSDYVSPVERELHALGLEEFEPLSCRSNEFRGLAEYYTCTVGPPLVPNQGKHKIIDIFRVRRPGEKARFMNSEFASLPRSNRMLLWHGSQRINYASILSQGLRIQPQGVFLNGSSLGAGVYFSDAAEKSLGYCGLASLNCPQDKRLLLLCDVELGGYSGDRTSKGAVVCSYRPRNSSKTAISSFVDGNRITPRLAGIKVPDVFSANAPQDSFGVTSLYRQRSEFCVYDVAQIQIRYLVFVGLG